MASVRKTPAGKWELRISSKLLPKPVYFTYDSESDARAYGEQVDRLLASGIIPNGLVQEAPTKPRERLAYVLRAWIATGKPSRTDVDLLAQLVREIGGLKLSGLTYAWAEQWVTDMKLVSNYAPGTIRKRLGSLSRCLDWYARMHPDMQLANPIKMLPRGSASYTSKDADDIAKLAADDSSKRVREDVRRDRRIEPGEIDRIKATLDGHKRDDRERPMELKERDALRMLFWLIHYTGVRLREAYTLRVRQVDMLAKVLRIKSSKQWHGREKWRQVPMRRELHALLTDYLASLPSDVDALLFPWWSGDDADLNRATGQLSGQFRRLFEYAQCPGLTEHDLRHEATCAWFEMRDAGGAWLFREAEIAKIMGWAPGSAMLARYASFRAEDLASRLW